MERIIDVHMHVGHRFEWTPRARAVWMDAGPYVPRLYDGEDRQLSERYGDVIKEEAWAGILIPEYSPETAGLMPFERAKEIARFHPELVPIANLNPNFHGDPMAAFDEQLAKGARALKIHPIHGFFFANDPRLHPGVRALRVGRSHCHVPRGHEHVPGMQDALCGSLYLR
jgi:hypothetical protein